MKPSFNQDEVFPVIAQIIMDLPGDDDGYRSHDLIVNSLIADPYGSQLISIASSHSGRDENWLASNMVAWFSQRITMGTSSWAHLFIRKLQGGKYSYAPLTTEPAH